MRESRTYGFVRGARGNSRPYRVRLLNVRLCDEAGGYCDAASRPLLKVLRTRNAGVGFVSP
jgi:hypothetical protein